MFSKILIANRGEIAVRIIRACKELGIKTVAVYSKADVDALHAKIADEAVCIGGPRSTESYLSMQNIIEAAVLKGAEAIHPGFGFLSENAKFAQICEECNIEFIGPSHKIISMMGDKATAKETMKKAGVPVIEGSEGVVQDVEEALSISDKIGYPVMIKASAGGGGRGIRIVKDRKDFKTNFIEAQTEAKYAFGDDSIYIEKFIEDPKHVEIQILADKHNNVVHLGERDCSVQRRNQKIIEEAPCSVIDESVREAMGAAAVKAAQYTGYTNAGTIEFLLDRNNDFYFMEMNTRIQVEHPVTEMITGIDIVKQQIFIASGEELFFTQEDVDINGHSIECRINAEDTNNNYMPSCGTIKLDYMPGGFGVRVDSCIYDGCEVTPYYDSMLAKLIVHGATREEAIEKMKSALKEIQIDGVKNNIELHLEILNDERFEEGDFTTKFMETR